MWPLLIPLALAAPPDGVDVEDVDLWEARSEALLAGPQGCWELEGDARVRAAVFTPGGLLGKPSRVQTTLSGPWTGRMEDGLWTRLEHQLQPTQEGGKLDVTGLPLHPMVGRVALQSGEDDDEQEAGQEGGKVSAGISSEGVTLDAQAWSKAANLVDDIIEAVDPEAVLAYASWDEARQGVEVVRSMPLGPRASADEVTLRSFLPLDGRPRSLDVEFPARIRMGSWPVRVTLIEPQLHLVSLPSPQGLLPAHESLSAILGVLGFTLGYEQTLAYRKATPCSQAE